MQINKPIRLLQILLTLLGFFLMSGCCFLAKQGYQLAKYQIRAQKVSRVLKKTTDQDLVAFLHLADEIRSFAIDSLGLKDTKNYTTYLENPKGYAADVVAASEPDTFQQRMWCYPIVGCVPYKGYLIPEDAAKQASRLREQGLDVYTFQADAFSTLGILIDPLVSYMQEYTAFELARLLIHEQTHATIYLKGEAQFNEELATFVGNEGAVLFLEKRFGRDSREYRSARNRLADSEAFGDHIEQLYARLDSLYSSTAPNDSLLALKRRIIHDDKEQFAQNYDSMFTTNLYRGFVNTPVNNAYLSVHKTYNQDLDLYYQLFDQLERDLRTTIDTITAVKKSKKPPKEYLLDLLDKQEKRSGSPAP